MRENHAGSTDRLLFYGGFAEELELAGIMQYFTGNNPFAELVAPSPWVSFGALGVMKPPKCKAMDEYASLLVKIGELEGAMVATRREIHSIPKRMARELTTECERLDAARYLYWFTDIRAQDIAEGLFGMDLNGWHVDRFLERIGTMTTDVTCDRCHQLVEFRSRQQMQDIRHDLRRGGGPKYPGGYTVLCAPCWGAVQQETMVLYQSGRRPSDDA